MTHVPDSSSVTPFTTDDNKTAGNDSTLRNIPETTDTSQHAAQDTGEFVVSKLSSAAVHDHEVDENLLKPLWFASKIVQCPLALCSTIIIILIIITFGILFIHFVYCVLIYICICM